MFVAKPLLALMMISMNNPRGTKRITYVCHQGEIASEEFPSLEGVVPLDLEAIPLRGRALEFGGRLAEARALIADYDPNLEFIGFLSWRFSEKLRRNISWQRVQRKQNSIRSGDVMSPYLARASWSIAEGAELSFPGMATLVSRLESEFPPRFSSMHFVLGNSFFSDVSTFLELQRMLLRVLDWDVWESDIPAPFKYRCHLSGLVTDSGHGRYRSNRDIGLFLEVATMYFFHTQVEGRRIQLKESSIRSFVRRCMGIFNLSDAFVRRTINSDDLQNQYCTDCGK
jgi:hypothetical protein